MTTLIVLAVRAAGCLLVVMLAQSVSLPAASAASPKDNDAKSPMKGRVETGAVRRVLRPDPSLQSGAAETLHRSNAGQSAGQPLGAQIDASNFTLDTDENAVQAGLNTDIVGGVTGAGEQNPPSILQPMFFNQTAEQPLAGINYSDIERAYAQAVPPVQSSQTPLQSALFAIRAQLRGVMGPAGTPLGAAGVDVDNCGCGTPIPSRQCMGERTSGIYGRSYAGSVRAFHGGGGFHYGHR